MADKIPVRVFDSVSAAVENSAPPEAPPYAVQDPEPADGAETAADPEQVPVARKAPAKRTPAKGRRIPAPIQEEPMTGVTVKADTAEAQTKAHGAK